MQGTNPADKPYLCNGKQHTLKINLSWNITTIIITSIRK